MGELCYSVVYASTTIGLEPPATQCAYPHGVEQTNVVW